MNRIYIFYLMALCAVGQLQCSFSENSSLFRGTYSENYIVRWAFQELCDHTFDPRTNPFAWPTSRTGVSFNPEKVKAGDLIFVRDVDAFFATLYKKIECPFVMITSGESRDKVEKRHMAYLDTKNIIAWFSVHPSCVTHPKFYPIPLGIFQDKKYYRSRKSLTHAFAGLRSTPKTELLYMNFGDLKGKKPERADVQALFKRAGYCYTVEKRLPFLEYMNEMAKFKFTLSPPGYGPDCYRTWEALLVGSIPIVKSSHLDSLFKGLPVLIVDDWSAITEEFLEHSYKRLCSKKSSIAPLFIEYWAQKIHKVKNSFMRSQKRKKS